MKSRFVIERCRLAVGRPDTCLVLGYFPENTLSDHSFQAYLGGKALPMKVTVQESRFVYRKLQAAGDTGAYIDREYCLWISLPEKMSAVGDLKIFECCKNERVLICRKALWKLRMSSRKIQYALDWKHEKDGMVQAGGWVVGTEACQVSVLDMRGKSVKSRLEWQLCPDLETDFPEFFSDRELPLERRRCRFLLSFRRKPQETVRIVFSCGGQKKVYWLLDRKSKLLLREMYSSINSVRTRIMAKRTKDARQDMPAKAVETVKSEVRAQERDRRSKDVQKSAPDRDVQFSIVVPLYRTPEQYLREMVASVKAQTWSGWELVLSDGSGADSPLTGILEEISLSDERIRVLKSDVPLDISENTNTAFRAAQGEYVAFMDHDDLLAPEALYRCAAVLGSQSDIEVLYTDEDKVSGDGETFFQPHFKPDFNLDLLRCVNYVCHLLVVKREFLEQVGCLDSRFDGAQDYDLILRMAEQTKRFCHIPEVLYHWRAHQDSTAADPGSKDYAFEAGRRALQAHLTRMGTAAGVERERWDGVYRVRYDLQEMPEISVIPVNLCTTARQANEAARRAPGKILLFLDERFEPIHADTLRKMASFAMRKEAGAVGGLVRYPDGTVCQAGFVIGRNGRIWQAFEGRAADDPGYFARACCAMDVSALSVSCMMVRRDIFEQMGGFDERFSKFYYDTDFCLRLKEEGKLAVYCPYAEFTGKVPAFRMYELTKEALRGYRGEQTAFCERWRTLLAQGDPNYNPNFSEYGADYTLRE